MTESPSTYNGAATVATRGADIPVTAELRIEVDHGERVDEHGRLVATSGLRSWGGTLTGDDPRLADVLTRMGAFDLRFPDGTSGRAHAAAGGSVDTGRPPTGPVLVEIQGEGRAPWIEAG